MNIEESVLPSGLRVVTANMPGFQTAAVAAFIDAGSRDERDDRNGIAHFLEHMAFKGTSTRSALDIARRIEGLGADINAFTSDEMTAYYVIGLRQHTPDALAIIGDVLTNSVFDDKEIETERGVILQEISRSHDNPSHVAYNLFGKLSFPDQALGRSILGPPDYIRIAERSHFTDFVGEHYNTTNMVVVGAGDIDHATFVEMVAENFAKLASGNDDRRRTPALYAGGIAIDTSRDFEQVTILYGLPTVSQRDPMAPAHGVLASALGGGMSSPLFQEVREKRGLVYAVSAGASLGSDHGMLSLFAGTTPDNVAECLKVARGEIEKIATNGVTQADFERAKNGFMVEISKALERPFSATNGIATSLFTLGRVRSPEEVRREVDAVTIDAVKKAAECLLGAEPTLAMVGPVPDADYEPMIRI